MRVKCIHYYLLEQLEAFNSKPNFVSWPGGNLCCTIFMLQKKIALIHEESEDKFDLKERYNSELSIAQEFYYSSTSCHNFKVTKSIITEVMSQDGCKLDKEVVKRKPFLLHLSSVTLILVGIKRCYQGLRRKFLLNKTMMKVYNLKDHEKLNTDQDCRGYQYQFLCTCQYNVLIQKFDKRSQVVSKTEYERYWKFLSVEYMTEESDDPDDDNVIIERKLTWRSESEFTTHALVAEPGGLGRGAIQSPPNIT